MNNISQKLLSIIDQFKEHSGELLLSSAILLHYLVEWVHSILYKVFMFSFIVFTGATEVLTTIKSQLPVQEIALKMVIQDHTIPIHFLKSQSFRDQSENA